MARWYVTRGRDDPDEDVGYDHVHLKDGALVFRDDHDDQPQYIIAAGQWSTVQREDDSP